MKSFWRRHTGLRRSSYGALFLFFLLIGALLYLAYIYMPSLDPNLYLPRWRKYDPHATIVEIDQASHTVHDSQPEQVNRLLLSFLAQL